MPLSWQPEGTQVMPGSDEMRTLAKWNQLLYDTVGERPSPFPEGVAPKPGDDAERLEMKINALLQ